MLKQCLRCNKNKRLNKFNFRNKQKGTYNCWCKVCIKNYDKIRYAGFTKKDKTNKKTRQHIICVRNRQWVWNYLKSHPCVDCKESDPIVLEFDHIKDKKNKKDLITNHTTNSSIFRLRKEISKCVVRCANCHRRKTANELKWYKYIKTEKNMKPLDPQTISRQAELQKEKEKEAQLNWTIDCIRDELIKEMNEYPNADNYFVGINSSYFYIDEALKNFEDQGWHIDKSGLEINAVGRGVIFSKE